MSEEKASSTKPAVAFVYDDVTHRNDPRMTKAIDQFLRILEMESPEVRAANTRIVPLSEYSESHFAERNSARLFVGFFPADTPRNVSVKIPLTEEDEKNIVANIRRKATYTHPKIVDPLIKEFGGNNNDSYEAKVRQLIGFDYMEGWHMGERLLRVAAPALYNSAVAFHEDLNVIRSKNQGHGNSSTRLILIGLMFDDAADRYQRLVTRHHVRDGYANLSPVEAMWMMWAKITLAKSRYWCPDRILMFDTRDFAPRLAMKPQLKSWEILLNSVLSLIQTVSRDAPFAALETITALGLANPSKFPLASHQVYDPRVLLFVAAMLDAPVPITFGSPVFIKYERDKAGELQSAATVCGVAVEIDRECPTNMTDENLQFIEFWSNYTQWELHESS